MTILLNGDRFDCEAGLTISGLLKNMQLADALVAVERNGEIVMRSAHATTEVQPDDRIEVVRAIGGGQPS